MTVAVLFLDLDNFKTINDSLGHDAGDRLLQAVAQRIVKSTRTSDTVARLGGDEFAILLERVASPAEVESVAASLIETLGQPFALNAVEVRVAASIGIAFSNEAAGTESLLGNADIAMYHAKAAGKNRYAVFEPQMQDVLHERLRLEADIGRAIDQEEFFLEYQPIVDLGTGSLLGVEALVRWRHPEAGVLMPNRFIPVAEECGQIVRLGRWVLLEACRALRAWRACVAGGNGLRVSVNISGRHLQHGELLQDVANALEKSGLEPQNLVIELTESTIMYNTEATLKHLRAVEGAGSPAGHRRFRHRLLLAVLSAPLPHRYPEDRPLVRQPADQLRKRTGVGARRDYPGRHPRPRHRGRGHRARAPGGGPARVGLRRRAGLPVCKGRLAGRRCRRAPSSSAAPSIGRRNRPMKPSPPAAASTP